MLVLEPRRIAARMAARRVASEMGEKIGETVGYHVRFDEVTGPRTRLRFVTEGVLTRRLISDPFLKGVDAVVLDEFHERHLEGDLALALLKRLQDSRPDLRIVIMSATLDAASVSHYLMIVRSYDASGKLFELSIEPSTVLATVTRSTNTTGVGTVDCRGAFRRYPGVFAGASEIHRAMRECQDTARRAGLLILPLHGSLSPEAQDRAVAPAAKPKLILATNVAESSITVDGVTAVIDSGLARLATWSQWTGLQTLEVSRISKASRKAESGTSRSHRSRSRLAPLHEARIITLRPEHDTPEILRSDLLPAFARAVRAMQIDIG